MHGTKMLHFLAVVLIVGLSVDLHEVNYVPFCWYPCSFYDSSRRLRLFSTSHLGVAAIGIWLCQLYSSKNQARIIQFSTIY